MAAWPRTIARGKLKGQTYESEGAYRRALSAALHKPSRYEQRNERAKAAGFRSYAEQRKARATVGEAQYLLIKKHHGSNVTRIVEREMRLFNKSTTEQRVTRVGKDLAKYGESELGKKARYVWQEVYRGRG